MKNYTTEREGQLQFFDNFRIDYKNNPVLVDNTDGVWNGNLFEFKLNIKDLNKVLLQAIKYQSKRRIKGENVPANILLIDLNKETCYQFKSEEYFDDIHKVYVGAASKNDEGFSAKAPLRKIDYSMQQGALELLNILTENEFMPVDIDENCIVGWAERYYRENPKATKGDFLGDESGSSIKVVGEIREPKHFKGLINPYKGETNEKFKYLMDKLNDRLKKKDLGAFYTPMPYCEKACELVKMAIDRVPEGNDYIILDRCAGTGNLEQAVLDVLGEEVASHIVCSTYEYYEYKVLLERLGDKVRTIIPPTEAHVEYANGCVMNADAMSEEYINNPIIKQYVDDPKCTIIMFENPPYRDVTSNTTGIANQQLSFVLSEMSNDCSGAVLNDLANRFIWSGYKYYLRQKTDSYILFSPIKYWKTCNLSNKLIVDGFLFNRKHFHATDSGIACILWTNENNLCETITLKAFDIIDTLASYVKDVVIKKVHKNFSSTYYDKRMFVDDANDGICCELSGEEYAKDKTRIRVKTIYNDNVLAYLRASSYNFDANSCNLLRCGEYDANGFYIRKDNYLDKLPLFVSKKYPMDNWYEKDIYATTSDGGNAYTNDPEFFKYCLIYTCLSNQNKCLSFHGSDGRDYQNELCFDNSREDKPIALTDLNKYAADKKTALNDDEKELLDLWKKILKEAKDTKNYDPKWNYGVYQITKELNTFEKDDKGNNVFDYPELNGDLNTLREKLKAYYKKYITPKMFEYELIK